VLLAPRVNEAAARAAAAAAAAAAHRAAAVHHGAGGRPGARGLHSSTFRLNLSAFCGIGLHLVVVQGVFRRCQGVLRNVRGVRGVFCVRNGSG